MGMHMYTHTIYIHIHIHIYTGHFGGNEKVVVRFKCKKLYF